MENMLCVWTFCLSVLALRGFCQAVPINQIHLSLNERQLMEIFSVSSHEEVPEYSLVHARSRTRRSVDGLHRKQVTLSAFGKRHSLSLTPNQHLANRFQVFYADSGLNGSTNYRRAHQVESLNVGQPYLDEKAGAALLIHHDPDNDALLLDGTIGPDLVVRAAPSSLNKHLDHVSDDQDTSPPDDEFFLDDANELPDQQSAAAERPAHSNISGNATLINAGNSNSSSHDAGNDQQPQTNADISGLHFVFKSAQRPSLSDFQFMEASGLPARSRRHRRSAPEAIYPEVLLIIDYDGFLMHEQNSNKIKKYFTSFMNGVDLRYRPLRNPEVKITIAGMIISRRPDATPYLERNMVTDDSIDSAAALTDMGRYLFDERRLPTYDIAMAITKHDLCRRRRSGKCTKGTAGFAYVGGACVVNKRLSKVNSVAIIEDTGGFSGIIVAAHELGHLLGNVHDGSPPPSYLGGPGARRCRWEEGYIMSDLRHTEKGFKWSTCSLEEFDNFLNGETASCLYNAPHERRRLLRHLPGKLLSLDAQCRRDRGTSACFKDDRVCSQLFCFDQSTGYCVSYRPAAEGSTCGDGKYCRDGYCVTDDTFVEDVESVVEGVGHYSYAANEFFTSATDHKPVWSYPPPQVARSLGSLDKSSSGSEVETGSTTEPIAQAIPRHHATNKMSLSSRNARTSEGAKLSTLGEPIKAAVNELEGQQRAPERACEDSERPLFGRLSCAQFVLEHGTRYCERSYFKRACCATRRLHCTAISSG